MLTSHISGLDHIICGVDDLDRAVKTFESLGFVLSPRGDHSAYGSHNRCIVFPDHYLEIFSFYDREKFPEHPMLPLTERMGEHILGVAYGTEDAEAAYDAMKKGGLDLPFEVFRQSRKMVDDNGMELVGEVAVAHLPPELQPLSFSFLCQHFNKETMWRADWIRHKNKVSGFRSLTVFTQDRAVSDAAGRVFDKHLPELTQLNDDGRFEVRFPKGTLIVEPFAVGCARFKDGTFESNPPLPFGGVITLESSDLAETLSVIRGAGLRCHEYDDRIVLSAVDVHGIALEIVPA